jgi:hypothetical protein
MPDLTAEKIQRDILAIELAQKKFELEELRAASARADGVRAADAAQVLVRVAAEKSAVEAAETTAASDKAAKAKAERHKSSIDNLEAVSSGLTKLTGSSVTFLEKSIFRDGSVSAAALDGAARAVADAICIAVPVPTDPILVTGRTNQVEVVLAYFTFVAAVNALNDAATMALGSDERRNVIAKTAKDDAENSEAVESAAPAALSGVLGAVVDVAIAIMGVLTVDATIEASESTTSEIVTHIAVIQRLLNPGAPNVRARSAVLHETVGVPSQAGTLLIRFEALNACVPKLDMKAAEYTKKIMALGDEPDPEVLAGLTARRDAMKASSAQISDFEAKATQTDATTGKTPLFAALQAQRLTGGAAVAKYVAIVLPARVNANQVTLKRRLFAPRIVVSASATIDLVVLDTQSSTIVAAGSYTDEKSFQVIFPMFWWGKNATCQPKYTTADAGPFA